jgi:hypothetical protein
MRKNCAYAHKKSTQCAKLRKKIKQNAQRCANNTLQLRRTALYFSQQQKQNMNTIILQIPLKEYGTIATLAAAAKMPLDKYIAKTAVAKKSGEEENAAILADK